MPLAANLLQTIGGAVVQGVTFSSQVTPDITLFDPNALPGQPGAPGGTASSRWIGNLVRPTVTVQTAAGPFQVAPFGVPETNYFAITAITGIAVLVGLVTMIGWIARKTK